eukprot:2047847-Amphidinium_carterae.1
MTGIPVQDPEEEESSIGWASILGVLVLIGWFLPAAACCCRSGCVWRRSPIRLRTSPIRLRTYYIRAEMIYDALQIMLTLYVYRELDGTVDVPTYIEFLSFITSFVDILFLKGSRVWDWLKSLMTQLSSPPGFQLLPTDSRP